MTEDLPVFESETVEFKTAFDREFVESLSAFANTRGGTVYLGIEDDGHVSGIQTGRESEAGWINQIKNTTSPALFPDIDFIRAEAGTVARFTITEYPIKPVACRNRYFKRVKNSNHALSIQEVVDMHLRTFNASWDFHPDPVHDMSAISFEKVTRFIERVNHNRETPLSDNPLEFLSKYELIREGRPTYACFLLFMKEETALTAIELGRFQTETLIKDSARSRTDLPTEAEAVMAFIQKHINKQIIVSGELAHEERWDYPINAIREIILNAVIHRDYTRSSDSIVKVFDDRIEIYNPGVLPPGYTVEKLLTGNYISAPRNKKIADMFKEAGIIEKYGSGIRRIHEGFHKMGLKTPVLEEIGEGFRVTVYSAKVSITPPITHSTDKTDSLLPEALSDKIINLIKKNNKSSANGIAEQLGISRDTVKEYLDKLKGQGRLRRIGSPRAGHWEAMF